MTTNGLSKKLVWESGLNQWKVVFWFGEQFIGQVCWEAAEFNVDEIDGELLHD